MLEKTEEGGDRGEKQRLRDRKMVGKTKERGRYKERQRE